MRIEVHDGPELSVADALEIQSERPGRTVVWAWPEGRMYTAKWGGRTVTAASPFGLDSRLSDIGCPVPRDVYCVHDKENIP